MKDAKSTRLGRPPKGEYPRKHTRSTTLDDAELVALMDRSEEEKRPIAEILRDAARGVVRGDVGANATSRAS